MKTKFNILLIVFVTALWACEKNDPLSDQGELTGNIVPFNLLAQMPDAAGGDTIVLRNVTWSLNDDIKSIIFSHNGFKLRKYEVKIAIPVEDGNNTVYQFAATHDEDSVIIPPTVFASYPQEGQSLEQYYQTLENAYVVQHAFVVPEEYRLSKQVNEELVLAMNDAVFQAFVQKFSTGLKRRMLKAIFPEISIYSTKYFSYDAEGNFTGDLTPEGLKYFTDNITRERLKDFVKEATVVDNTRVTIQTEASVKGSTASTKSSRIFKVI